MPSIEDFSYSRLLRVSNIHSINTLDTRSNFTVNLNRMTETNNIVRCVLKSVSFPNTAYNVNIDGPLKNNVFSWTVNGTPYTYIQSTSGYYSTSYFLTQISPIIDAQVRAIDPAGSFVMTLGSNSKVIECVLTGTGVTVIISGDELNKSLGNTEALTIVSSLGGTLALFNEVPDLVGLDNVYVHSTQVAEGNLVDGDVETHDVLAEIPVGGIVPFGGTVHYLANDDELESINYRSARNYDNLNFSLRDLNNNIINLKGGQNTTIVLKIYYF